MDFSAEYLARVQSEMHGTMARLQRAISIMPAATVGWDTSECVGVELDRDARLTHVSFHEDWREHLEPEHLAEGVLAAYASAHLHYGITAEKAREFVDSLPDSEFAGAPATGDDPFVRLLASAHPFADTPRSIGEIAEDFLAIPAPTVDGAAVAQAPANAAADQIVIGSTQKNVSVVFEGDHLASIRFDARWADRQTGDTLESAVMAAIRAERSPQRASPAVDTSGTRDVIAEALQLLKDLAHPPTDPKETP